MPFLNPVQNLLGHPEIDGFVICELFIYFTALKSRVMSKNFGQWVTLIIRKKNLFNYAEINVLLWFSWSMVNILSQRFFYARGFVMIGQKISLRPELELSTFGWIELMRFMP